jgi:hypothetical protein
MTAIDRAALRTKHYEIAWYEEGDDGLPNMEKPLGSFCAACTDEEYVGAVEYGDMIDAASAVVAWPCELLVMAERADAAEERARSAEAEATSLRELLAIAELALGAPGLGGRIALAIEALPYDVPVPDGLMVPDYRQGYDEGNRDAARIARGQG